MQTVFKTVGTVVLVWAVIAVVNPCCRSDVFAQSAVAKKVSPVKQAEMTGYWHSRIDAVLNIKLWRVGEHVVTVKATMASLLVVLLGILLSKYLSWLIGSRFLKRTNLDENGISITQKAIFYFLLLSVFVFAFRLLRIPLTAFAFMGGALAIGLGFGAQTILSNFISGFIIMAERPIRIGDLIEIDATFATVEEIGFRCTRIRTADNVHILVPNSKFLDQNIVNWTLSDKQIRAKVSVGVIYGSSVQTVKRLLLKTAAGHPDVRKDPEPYVRFTEFGDNALIFDLYFWVSMVNLYERKRISSEIRFHIDELFREAGIVIAFPQRDVHLDTLKPLDVRIVKPPEEREK